MDNGTNTLAFVHQVKSLVDLLQAHGVGDEGVQRDLAALSSLEKLQAHHLYSAAQRPQRKAHGSGGLALAVAVV